ncbi:MAG: Inner membrane protein YqiK [Phycisphaerae bacterium]|nr:Inner membrane protein YqiK [Phycisphaerae bacterium]
MMAMLNLAAVNIPGWGWLVIGIGGLFFFIFVIFAARYRKAGPNEALIIYGGFGRSDDKGNKIPRIIKGGGGIVWPIIESFQMLSLELMTIDVLAKKIYTITGVAINVDAVAQIKVRGDDISISTAAERFLSMGTGQMMEIAKQTLEGHLRAIVGTLTVEEIYKDRDRFTSKVQEVAAGDMANMGLSIDSFTLRDIQDEEGYLEALGRPRISQVKRDAVIAEAEAKRDADIKSAQAQQSGKEAEFVANTKIAEAQRDYESKRADYQAAVNLRKAESDLAYELQKNKTAQLVKAEEIKIAIIEREKSIELQDKEIARKQKELAATVNAAADAERYRIEAMAKAAQMKRELEAKAEAAARQTLGEGEGAAAQALGEGEAAAIRARGIAQADIVAATGAAEAEAMRKKADAYQQYNQAAVLQMIVQVLPQIAKEVASPLTRVDKINIVDLGGSNGSAGSGASKITRDVTEVIAQLPPILESLSGVNLQELLKKLPGLADVVKSSGDGQTSPPAKTSDVKRV